MDERLRFVARLLDSEATTEAWREFGISRKTGYKIFDRYKEHGLEALSDRSRRPVRYANQLPPQIESLIVGLNPRHPIRPKGVTHVLGTFRYPCLRVGLKRPPK
jgi:transposase